MRSRPARWGRHGGVHAARACAAEGHDASIWRSVVSFGLISIPVTLYPAEHRSDPQRAAPEATQTVDIKAFVVPADIDLIYYDKPYSLEPIKKGRKGYALPRETPRETGKVGIAWVVIRTRQYIVAMVPRDDVLVLNLLRVAQTRGGFFTTRQCLIASRRAESARAVSES